MTKKKKSILVLLIEGRPFLVDGTDYLPGQRRREIYFQQPWLQSRIYEHIKAIEF